MGYQKVFLTGVISLLLAILMVLMSFMPQVAQAHAIDQQAQQIKTASDSSEIIDQSFPHADSVSNSLQQGIGIDLQALLDATTDLDDTDSDSLPDSVEWVLGTDPENVDSDFDTLDDYYEAANGLDPMKADSNSDGLVDNLEIKDVASDFDSDGIPNIWDDDNDDDGVPDYLDRSPFAKSIVSESFHFDVQTNGNPTYVDFQIKPENDWHLKLQGATFDWPTDTEGQMQDRDDSLEDVKINPVLELTLNSRPEQSDVEDYNIIVPQDVDITEGFVTHGTTIADINGNGYLDLILFGGDDAADPNQPGYIIGWDIRYAVSDSMIVPSRWSPLKIQPNLGDYMGAGAATDLNSNGKLEIYVPRVGDGFRSPIYYGVDLDNYGDQQRPGFSSSFSPLPIDYSFPSCIGSGLDIADIDGNGTPDILATVILEGTNELAYVIGWDLDNNRDISDPVFGRASAWSYSPSWYPNGGLPPIPQIGGSAASVAVKIADIDGNGMLDWLLMGTDSVANELHYMIGWNLDASGVPESWSEIKTSPQISGAAAGGSAAATDLNGNGTLDLLLLAVDNAERHNFHYIIGWDLDVSGDPVNWSSVQEEQGTSRTERVYVPLTPVVDFGTNVAFSGRMFFPAGSAADISIDARLVWMVTGKTDSTDDTSENIMLAKYREDFMLTGFSATENYGTDAGLFYSDNRDQTIAAGFVLAYEFLRTQAPLSDIPAELLALGVSNDSSIMRSQIASFPHQDAALVGLTSNMTEDALELLPDGHILPVLLAMEDRFTSTELSEMVSTNEDSSFSTDLRSIPITTAKMFRMNWYDTTTEEPVREGIIIGTAAVD